uniref:Vesicle transport protein n=1 Tax=Panagrolaimus superbus TaxID=310955 RepID=A0A914XUR6_9BILA
MFERLKTVVGSSSSSDLEATNNSNDTTQPEIQNVNGLSWDLRVQCFILAFMLSMICSFLGTPLLVSGKFTGFAVMVSLGGIISLLSTCFLSGPIKQLKKMFEPTRIVASLIYILMIILTFIAGLVMQNVLLAVICTGGQYIAMAWYSLSYIPYAREMLLRCFGRCF